MALAELRPLGDKLDFECIHWLAFAVEKKSSCKKPVKTNFTKLVTEKPMLSSHRGIGVIGRNVVLKAVVKVVAVRPATHVGIVRVEVVLSPAVVQTAEGVEPPTGRQVVLVATPQMPPEARELGVFNF